MLNKTIYILKQFIIPISLGVCISLALFKLYQYKFYTPSLLPLNKNVSPFEHRMEQLYLTKIKQKTYLAYSIIQNIYTSYKGTLSEAEIKQHIKAALRPMRFNTHNYFFIVNTNGTEELFPVMPQLEGKNLINLQDLKGSYVIQEEIKLAKTKQEGFVSGYWKTSTSDKAHLKMSFIKLFSPLHWIVGYGEFTNLLEKEIHQKVRR